MKNNKGITLIALVVTIIVLLILAGVSIAMLTGENGLLSRSKEAKVTQIEQQIDEEVKLAIGAAKLYAEQQAVATASGYSADAHLAVTSTANDDASAADIIATLRKDLTTEKGYTKIEGTNTSSTNANPPVVTPGSIEITYTTDAYKEATNKSNAKIVITYNVSKNTFTYVTTNYTK